MAEIQDAIRLMRERLTSGQGTEASAACRLSLRMAETLMAKYEWLKDLWAEETPPVVPEGYRVVRLDGRWRLFGEGTSDPLNLLYSDDCQDGSVDARAALALCWSIVYDREPVAFCCRKEPKC